MVLLHANVSSPSPKDFRTKSLVKECVGINDLDDEALTRSGKVRQLYQCELPTCYFMSASGATTGGHVQLAFNLLALGHPRFTYRRLFCAKQIHVTLMRFATGGS